MINKVRGSINTLPFDRTFRLKHFFFLNSLKFERNAFAVFYCINNHMTVWMEIKDDRTKIYSDNGNPDAIQNYVHHMCCLWCNVFHFLSAPFFVQRSNVDRVQPFLHTQHYLFYSIFFLLHHSVFIIRWFSFVRFIKLMNRN